MEKKWHQFDEQRTRERQIARFIEEFGDIPPDEIRKIYDEVLAQHPGRIREMVYVFVRKDVEKLLKEKREHGNERKENA